MKVFVRCQPVLQTWLTETQNLKSGSKQVYGDQMTKIIATIKVTWLLRVSQNIIYILNILLVCLIECILFTLLCMMNICIMKKHNVNCTSKFKIYIFLRLFCVSCIDNFGWDMFKHSGMFDSLYFICRIFLMMLHMVGYFRNLVLRWIMFKTRTHSE